MAGKSGLNNPTSVDLPPSPPDSSPADVVRLSVNLSPDVGKLLKDLVKRKRISLTEGVRRAIAVWNFLELERDKGNRIAIIENDGGKDRVREVLLVD